MRPARTSSIIYYRNSGGYGLRDFPTADSILPKDRVPTKPGQLQGWVIVPDTEQPPNFVYALSPIVGESLRPYNENDYAFPGRLATPKPR